MLGSYHDVVISLLVCILPPCANEVIARHNNFTYGPAKFFETPQTNQYFYTYLLIEHSTSHKMPRRQQRARLQAYEQRPKPTFAFLELPAELRNKVYEFALTAADGIKVSWRTGKSRRRKKPVMLVDGDHGGYPINQLQYVNRQIYNEAAGLEV